jgi:hypothetical protein
MNTTSLRKEPREITSRLSDETPKAKILSESNAVSFLGALPSSGTDQMFPTPFVLRENRIDFAIRCPANCIYFFHRNRHCELLEISSGNR